MYALTSSLRRSRTGSKMRSCEWRMPPVSLRRRSTTWSWAMGRATSGAGLRLAVGGRCYTCAGAAGGAGGLGVPYDPLGGPRYTYLGVTRVGTLPPIDSTAARGTPTQV